MIIGDANAQPIQNLIPNPFPASSANWSNSNSGAGGASVLGYDATLQAAYSEVTTAATNQTFTMRYGNGPASRPLTRGDIYYWSQCEVMSTVTDARAIAIDFYNSGGTQLPGVATGARVVLPANQWVPVFIGGICGDLTAIASSVCVIYTGSSGTAPVIRPVGSRLHIRRGMLVPGIEPRTTPLPYQDGDSAAWRWTGTANGSISVGWPQ